MSKISYGLVITLSMILAFSISFTTSNAQESPRSPVRNSEEEKYYPLDTIFITEVINKGTKIPFHIIKNDPDYKRPVHEKYWH